MTVLGGTVAWVPQTSYHGLLLRITGGGERFEKVFRGGETPVFFLVGSRGGPLADGLYNWELREAFPPINDGAYDPENGRDGNGEPRRAPVKLEGRVQSGAFTIRNGAVLNPALIEEPAGGTADTTERD